METSVQQRVSLLPTAAFRHTFNHLAKMYSINMPVNFENSKIVIQGWSLKYGMDMMIGNFFLYTAVGVLIDVILNAPRIFSEGKCRNVVLKIYNGYRRVIFENINEGVLIVHKLKDSTMSSDAPSYNFVVEKSKALFLIGEDDVMTTGLLELLAGERTVGQWGLITVKDNDFFSRSSKPKTSEFFSYRPAVLVLDEELTATQHLNLFAHLRGN